MSYVVDVGYALDLSQIGAAINKFKELQKEVGKTDKALNSMGKSAGSSSEAKRTKEMKDLGSAAESASKKVKQVGDSAAQAGDKFDKLIEKNQLVRQYMVDGFTKGEAKILATAKQAGILESQFASLQHTLLQVAKLSSDPFDNSRGSIRALEKDITSLRDRMELSAKGIYANTNQMRLFGRAAEEVRGEIEKLGIKLDSPAGQAEYNKRLGERREKLTALIRETNNLNEVERQAQRIAKENQRILERTASVERRMSVRQTSKEFGVNLQDASFILDAKATGNMQLYNKALESTRKTMLETIPVATTLKTLIPAIGAVGGVAFLAQATREFLKMADSMRLVEARINLVSTAGADASQVLDQLVEISKENRVNLDTTSRLYTRLVPAMESFKVNLEGSTSATDAALKVTKAFGAALLISGANTQEAIAATTQFTQAMASGKLAGDEFRSVSEAAPAFLKAIADGSGYARSELKALSSEGKLTTELISQALLKMQSSLEAKAAKVPVTMGQAFERVKTDLMVFSRDLNESTGAVDGVVSAIETLGIVIQGLGSGLAMMKEAVDPLNDSLNGMGTSLGQLLFAASSVYALSKVLASVIGVAGIAGAATTAGGALVTATAAMRGYAAATAISIAATGTLSTALFAARGAVLALGAALASTPIGVILAGAATAAGILYFNSEQAAVQISKLAEEKEGSIKSTKVLLESEEKLAKSWDDLIKKAPEVGQAIQKSFDSSGVKFLTDDQQRELEESMKRIQKLREDVSKDNLSGRERVEKNELIIALKKEYDARYRTFALQQQIDMFNSTSDGAASDMIKKLQDEVKQREQVNKLLREGVSLRKAELIAAGTAAIQQQYGTPTIMPGEGPIQFEARKLSIKRQIAEQEATLRGEVGKLTTLEEEQAAILDSQKKSKKEKTNSLLEELQALEKLLPLAKQIGDVEKARLIAGGVSAEQAQRLLDLRKQIQTLENAGTRAEETALVQREYDLLVQGVSIEETKLILEQESLKVQMKKAGYIQDEISKRLEQKSVIEGIKKAEEEAKKAALEYQKEKEEFMKPTKLEIGDLFGDAAKGAGTLLNTMYDIAEQQKVFTELKQKAADTIQDEKQLTKELSDINKKQAQNELANMRSITGGVKQLFKEKSTGYKVLEKLEQAMFIMQLYNQRKEITTFLANIATKIGAAGSEAAAFIGFESAKATAAGTTAVAAQAQVPVAGFAMAAAMAAILVGLGVALKGRVSGGKGESAPVYNEGKGTVLGNKDAQSESVKKSIESLEKYASVELPITSAMLKSLQNIEGSIAGLGNLIFRSPNGQPGSNLTASFIKQSAEGLSKTSESIMTGLKVAGAVKTWFAATSFSGSLVALLTTASGWGIIASLAATLIPGVGKAVNKVIGSVVGGLFGKTSVKTNVVASGLTAPIQTLKQMFEQGFNLLEYIDVEIVKKKKSWFGSKKSVSYATQTAQADKEVANQFSLIFSNFYDVISKAATPLGRSLDSVQNTLLNFVVDIGKINLSGLGAKEIQEKLEAVFGQQADRMAQFALAGFEEFQRIGEGYFTTITRLASDIERARLSTKRFGVELISLSDVIDKQADIAVELLRQSLVRSEYILYGMETGFAEIVNAFSGSIDDLDSVVKSLNALRSVLSAMNKPAVDLSKNMIDGANGFEELSGGLNRFYEDVLTEGERYSQMLAELTKQFSMLGVTIPESVEGFKKLVQGVDTSTEAGQKLFGALVALTPKFLDLIKSMETLGVSAELLSTKYLRLEDKFKALGVEMPTSVAAFDDLLNSFNFGKLTSSTVINSGNLDSALSKLANVESSVAVKTNGLEKAFGQLGLSVPSSRYELDKLILSLKNLDGSNTSASMSVESLASLFDDLMVDIKLQGALLLAVGYATEQLNKKQSEFVGQNLNMASGLAALSVEFYELQNSIAEFGGEAGKAVSSMFTALFNARQAVSEDYNKIAGVSTTLTPEKIREGIQASVSEVTPPGSANIISLVEQRLALQERVSQISNIDLYGPVEQAAKALAQVEAARDSSYSSWRSAVGTVDNVLSSVLNQPYKIVPVNNAGGVGFSYSRDELGGISSDFMDLLYLGNQKWTPGVRQELANKGAGYGTTGQDILKGSLNSTIKASYENYVKYQEISAAAQAEYNKLLANANLLSAEKLEKERQILALNIEVQKAQDEFKNQLKDFAIDAEGNAKRLDKLRSETVKYYEAQKKLSDLMNSSAEKLNATLSSIRDVDLSPQELLKKLEAEFADVYAKASVAEGEELAILGGELDKLIKPLLDQAALVYATGGEAQNIKDFILTAGDEIAARLEEFAPKDFQEESLKLLEEIDSALVKLEEAAVGSNKMLVAAIDLSRVQTVAELEQITRLLGGTPAGKSVPMFAAGGVFSNSVVSSPTMFPVGLMGEAGPEAIMPLSRSGDGSLGVRVVGGVGDNSALEQKLEESNRHQAALVQLQSAANRQIINKLGEMEERLSGMESAARLQVAK